MSVEYEDAAVTNLTAFIDGARPLEEGDMRHPAFAVAAHLAVQLHVEAQRLDSKNIIRVRHLIAAVKVEKERRQQQDRSTVDSQSAGSGMSDEAKHSTGGWFLLSQLPVALGRDEPTTAQAIARCVRDGVITSRHVRVWQVDNQAKTFYSREFVELIEERHK